MMTFTPQKPPGLRSWYQSDIYGALRAIGAMLIAANAETTLAEQMAFRRGAIYALIAVGEVFGIETPIQAGQIVQREKPE
jgi:hypothetical protein